jgi:hypothetical protein
MTAAAPDPKLPFVTVTHGMRGYFAVLMWWNANDEFWEPWSSGFGSYNTYEEAIPEARAWAEAEDVECRLRATH